MADHLWQRPSGWTYQRRVPKPLVKYCRRTVLRVSLGRLPFEVARSRARLLSVRVDRARDKVAMMEHEGSPMTVEEVEAEIAAIIKSFDNNIAMIGEAMSLIKQMGEVHERERASFRTAMQSVGVGPAPPLPLFSAFSDKVVAAKAKALDDSKGYAAKLRNAARAWVLVHGDRPLDAYKPSLIQDFATALASLPKSWAVTPRLRGLTYAEVVADFQREQQRAAEAGRAAPQTFSRTTIGEYVAQVRHILQHARADHPDRIADFGAAPMTLPRAARPAKTRGPLDVAALSTWFVHMAARRRADDRFLPLLGVLTGARLGELANLQPKDLRKDGAHWVLDLREDLDDGDGGEEERPLKTFTSRRVVVLHDVIEQTGFIAWVRGLHGPWVFPRLHKVGADKAVGRPAATASKRMIRSMKEVGIHVPTVGVFHSVRHGLKDWLRDHYVSERTIDLQVGHAHESVSASYGSQYLRTEEIHLLATLPLPDGLDLSPYIEKSRTSGRRR